MADSNQIRINELARELEVKAKVLIDFLPEIGVTEKKTHSSSLDLEHAELARKHFAGLAAKEAAAEADKQAKAIAAKKPAARPTVTAAPTPSVAKPAQRRRQVLLLPRLRSPRRPVRFLQARRRVLQQRLPHLRRRLQPRALIHLLKHLRLRSLEWLPQPPRPRLQQDLELPHLRRAREFRLGLPHPVSRALLLHNVLPLLRHREVQHRHQERARVRRVLRVLLLRKAKDFQFVPVDHHLVGSHVPARLRVFVPRRHLAKLVRAARAPACHCAREADLREDILSVPVAPANEVAGPIKDPSADSVPVQPAELEFRRLNPASRFTRANLPRRAAVRSSRSVTRKVNANFIRCGPARVRAQDGRRKLNPSRQYSASPGK